MAHLEKAFAVTQDVCEQAVRSGPAGQRGAQHAAIWQHQLLQQAEVVLPGVV